MWGTIVAKKRPNKDGKYRSYLKWLAIPLALSQLVCFIDVRAITNKQWALLLFAYVTYIAFGMLYTGMNVPFGSLASVITDDPDGRTLLSTFRSIGKSQRYVLVWRGYGGVCGYFLLCMLC